MERTQEEAERERAERSEAESKLADALQVGCAVGGVEGAVLSCWLSL